MNILMERDLLVNAVSQIQGIVETRKTIPILSHMLLEAKGDEITLFSTDLEVGIRIGMTAEVLGSGEIAIPAKRFYDILRELPPSSIKIEVSKDLIMNIQCEKAEFRLKGIAKEEFPQLPKTEGGEEISITRDILRDMIQKTIFAVSTDQTRYSLAGVFLQLGDDVRMVATDGHRLAIVRRPRKDVEGELRREAIIPKKALVEVLKMLKEEEKTVTAHFVDSQIVFQFKNATLVSRLIEEQFPNYGAVIPQPADKRATVNKDALWGALRRTSTIVGERGTPTKIELRKNTMLVTCTNMDLGEARESLDVQYDGEEIAIGFNARYLLDFLSAIEEEQVVIYLSDGLSPTLFQPLGRDSYQCVIMPMRI